MSFPVFASGDVLNASDMNAVGWWKINTTTVSAGVSSVSVNNVFTSDYTNYRIVFELNGSSSGSFARFRLRANGVDTATGNYYRYGYTVGFGTAIASYNAAGETAFNIVGQWVGSIGSTCYMDISNPFVSGVRTNWLANTNDNGAGASYNLNGVIDLTTAYDGFTVLPAAGTLNAGVIRVYGYRN